MKSDIEIARSVKPFKINKIAAELNLSNKDIICYGNDKAKIDLYHKKLPANPDSKLILVTAMTPTPAGEGKSTVSIGLADALKLKNKKAALSLREPSLGPCFGIKGGATGGGRSQVIPMEDINLNFTGDIHAITAANNLLCALIDNHIKHGNNLGIQKVYFRRCMDLNDRALREINVGLGSSINGIPRPEGFDISVASEIMAILCLADDMEDLKHRMGHIVIGEDVGGDPIIAHQLHAEGAMAAILKDAILPNLVQTLEHTPAFIHGGPFANIAHGTSSIIATRTALSLADYVVTEAGFGADLGMEKYLDIITRGCEICPSAIVLVATVRALKMHGGIALNDLSFEDLPALQRGFANLKTHIENIQKFGYNPIVAVNRFSSDTPQELQTVIDLCQSMGIKAVISEGWEKGGKGCLDLADTVLTSLETDKPTPCLLYEDGMELENKIITIAKRIYRAKDVSFTPQAERMIKKIKDWKLRNLPVCIAKTQNSISHDPKLLGSPHRYTFPVTDIHLSAGAGFVVVLSGKINTMPGLPEHPAAEKINVDKNGIISGLF